MFFFSLFAERYVPPHLRRNPQELFHNDPRNPVNFPNSGGPQGYPGGGRDGGFRGSKFSFLLWTFLSYSLISLLIVVFAFLRYCKHNAAYFYYSLTCSLYVCDLFVSGATCVRTEIQSHFFEIQ